ncbi:MAG: hypothetical protein HY543_04675 [Deltaproteobacteria bacterium]|nr:hypothetical protein [Deltaproteobacteria bacterium]
MIETIAHRLRHVHSLCDEPDLKRAIAAIPKCELHVHLAGAIRRHTLLDLAKRHGVALPADEETFLASPSLLLLSSGEGIWDVFHRMYQWCWSCVQSCEDLERIVFEFLEDSARQGVIHSEFTVSGTALMRKFPFDEWAHAVAMGIDRARRLHAIRAAAILDISRRSGPAQARANVERVVKHRPRAICGIGMGGDEVTYPDALFHEAFACARTHKIPSTVHVAEFNPGETTVTALEMLQPDRLGHALTTIGSAPAYALMRARGIPVEICPVGNFVTGAGNLQRLADHPIRRYYDDGIPLSINTDDPRIFGVDLIDTYICLVKELGFTLRDFATINAQAMAAGFVVPSLDE